MLVSMSKAAKISASDGGQVSIDAHNIGSTQLINYIVRWDNAKDYAKSKDMQRTSKAWVDFWAESNANPAGELVASFSANNLDGTRKAPAVSKIDLASKNLSIRAKSLPGLTFQIAKE